MKLSVIIPTCNPHPGRLRRTLAALQAQTLSVTGWETLVVDNASEPSLVTAGLGEFVPSNLRLTREPEPGLSHARRHGFLAAQGEILVLVDDDNRTATIDGRPASFAEGLCCKNSDSRDWCIGD